MRYIVKYSLFESLEEADEKEIEDIDNLSIYFQEVFDEFSIVQRTDNSNFTDDENLTWEIFGYVIGKIFIANIPIDIFNKLKERLLDIRTYIENRFGYEINYYTIDEDTASAFGINCSIEISYHKK